MTQASFFKIRVYMVVVVTIAIESLLTWNYLHDGIPRHHILADKDLPEISNAWGGVLLPLLAWFLTWRIQKRTEINIRPIAYAFVCSLLYGTAMVVSFSLGYPDVTGYMMMGIFVLALFFPVFRSEYLLGYVLGMTFTFGAVLPTGVGTILCGITAVLYLGVRRAAKAMRRQ
jgi:hypothetical protein